MNNTLQTIFGLFGGLAIFIFGMNMMSECLQKAAGEKMKNILSILTKNPLLGVLAGALTTAVLQSSSATTVMAIGFVSAGLMSLPQAISIILGANIGTTMTAQIIAFKITDYIYLFIFAGFLISFVCKKERAKNIGQTIFAFGLLFLGIETMGGVMKPLANSPVFIEVIEKVSDIPVLGVLAGTAMTLVVQSSSATIAVLQNFASQAGPDGVTSVIGLAGAIPFLLGDNIGTTITALLASVGQSKDAKRTALAHSLFNISGAFLFIWFVKPYAAIIKYISPKGNEVDVISRQIANAHTGFNIVMTLIWLPLIWLLVKIVVKAIPDGKADKKSLQTIPEFIDDKLMCQPAAALHLLTNKVIESGKIVQNILQYMKENTGKNKSEPIENVIKKADNEHELYNKINEFIAGMLSEGTMTENQVCFATELLDISHNIERIGILSKEITDIVSKNKLEKNKLSKEALKDLRKSFSSILKLYDYSFELMCSGASDELVKKIEKRKYKVLKLDDKMRIAHIERIGNKKCDVKLTGKFNEILHELDRMANCCVNLADRAVESAGVLKLPENNVAGTK